MLYVNQNLTVQLVTALSNLLCTTACRRSLHWYIYSQSASQAIKIHQISTFMPQFSKLDLPFSVFGWIMNALLLLWMADGIRNNRKKNTTSGTQERGIGVPIMQHVTTNFWNLLRFHKLNESYYHDMCTNIHVWKRGRVWKVHTATTNFG
jgi:hypothetical protein